MSAHQEPTYKDALAVTAGLERLTEDLLELAEQVSATAEGLHATLLRGGQAEAYASALHNTHRQLHWLTADVERMQAGLAGEETHHDS